jgi:hypothetical protein
MIGGVDAGSVEVLSAVRQAGLPCYALTNMEAETDPLRLERFPFLGWFDGTVVSGREEIAKPDHAILRRLLDRFGLRPDTTLMIDDTRGPASPRLQAHFAQGKLCRWPTLISMTISGGSIRCLGVLAEAPTMSVSLAQMPLIWRIRSLCPEVSSFWTWINSKAMVQGRCGRRTGGLS